MKMWGEIPVVVDTESGIAALEREQITKPRSLIVEGPRLFQPTSTSNLKTDRSCEQFGHNPIIIHTIKLLQYASKVRTLINQAQQRDSVMTYTEQLPSTPSIPSCDGPDIKEKSDNMPVRFLDSVIFSNVSKLQGPRLTKEACGNFNRHSVGVMCAHAGFEVTPNSVLEFLTDVTQEYTRRICRLLRVSVDREGLTGSQPFNDVVEKVFYEIGIGSVLNLVDFYDNRIIKYRNNILINCQNLQETYEKLRNPDDKIRYEDLKTIRIKEEPVMEIEFPILEEIEEGAESNENIIHLEELQTLHNIETTLKEEENIKWPSTGQSNSNKDEGNNMSSSSQELSLNEEVIDVNDSPVVNDPTEDAMKDPSSVSASEAGSPSLKPKILNPSKRRRAK